MTALANINGKEIEVFVHEIICKDGNSVAVVNKGSQPTMFKFGVKVSATNIIEV